MTSTCGMTRFSVTKFNAKILSIVYLTAIKQTVLRLFDISFFVYWISQHLIDPADNADCCYISVIFRTLLGAFLVYRCYVRSSLFFGGVFPFMPILYNLRRTSFNFSVLHKLPGLRSCILRKCQRLLYTVQHIRIV
jgi:hypothetical protein